MEIRRIPTLFGLPEASELTELTAGHINRTLLAVCGEKKYVLQSLNRSVFCAPEAVMDNISRIGAAFSEAEHFSIAVPHFIACGDKNYAVADGKFWRIYSYIAATADAAADAAAAGRAFGTFIRIMKDKRLSSAAVIDGFHDFDRYFSVLAAKGGIDRSVMAVLDKLRDTLSQVFTGTLKKRVIHGDAKPDNLIFSEVPTIIDLDTAMCGYAATDYGDLVRSVFRSEVPDLSDVRDITRGFAEGLDGLLSADEIYSLYYGILWLTGELAMRYLIDFRSEEKYFRGKTSADCLSRAEQLLRQLKIFRSHREELTEIIYASFD